MTPKIFVFSSADSGTKEGPCYALAEDGTLLGQHYCSDEIRAKSDLGVTEGCRADRHKEYASYYPNGYEMEFIPVSERDGHAGLAEAMRLNKERP